MCLAKPLLLRLQTSCRISNEEAQTNIERRYEWWESVCRDTTEFSADVSDTKRAWKSFSTPDINQITALKMPVFIPYGTEDYAAQICDILPVLFELAGKRNYKMRPFIGCGHNFEEIAPDGRHNWDKMYWNDVVNEFLFWIENLNK